MSIDSSCMNISDMQRQLYTNMINAATINVKAPEPIYQDCLAYDADCNSVAPKLCGTFTASRVDRSKVKSYIHDGKMYPKDAVPDIDLKDWANKMGLKLSENGKTLTCYKTVIKTEHGRYLAIMDNDFEYRVGEYAESEEFNPDKLMECSSGLHGTSVRDAITFAIGCGDSIALLELKVDVSDPNNFVIPYADPVYRYPNFPSLTTLDTSIGYLESKSNKIRFKRCFVAKEIKVKNVYINEETGEIYE